MKPRARATTFLDAYLNHAQEGAKKTWRRQYTTFVLNAERVR